jgi:uncharacterized protein
MSFTDKLNNDIKQAMLAKDKERLAALRDVKAKILLEATSGAGEVTDETAQKIVMKLFKQRMETYALYTGQNRDDLAQVELFQAEVIKAYMPEMMSDEEVRAAVRAKITQVGAAGPQDMGKVMGPLTKELAGKADGAVISAMVKEELAK